MAALRAVERAPSTRLTAAPARWCVDAVPGRLGIELVDTYLALKASGRL